MDARTFIYEKNAAAVEELKAIDIEYMPRRNAVLDRIAMTEKWIEEIEVSQATSESAKAEPIAKPMFAKPTLIIEESEMAPIESWRSARDLQPKVRQAS